MINMKNRMNTYDEPKSCKSYDTPIENSIPKHPKMNLKKTLMTAIIITLSLILTCSLSACKNNYSTVDDIISTMENSMKNPDLYEFCKLGIPEDVLGMLIDESFDGDEEKFKDYMDNGSDFWIEEYANADIEILSVERIGDINDMDDASLEETNRDLAEFDTELEDAKTCMVKIRYKQQGERKSHEEECEFYKTNGKWFLHTDSEYLLGCFW